MNLLDLKNVNQPLPGERDPAFKGYVRCPMKAYRDWAGLNAGLVALPTACEMLQEATKGYIEKHTDDTTIGTLLHWAVLEPWHFDDWEKYMVACETASVTTKAADALRADNPGKLVVTPEMVEQAERCRWAVRQCDEAMKWLDGEGAKKMVEASGFVLDPRTGIWRKIRVDLLPAERNYLVDVKTTSRHPKDFKSDMYSWGYHHGACWYLDTHELLTGERREWYVWIVVNKQKGRDRPDMPEMCRVVLFRNRRHSELNYSETVFCKSREWLGLDASERIGSYPMFVNALNQHYDLIERFKEPTKEQLRRVWDAYEQENPVMEIIT